MQLLIHFTGFLSISTSDDFGEGTKIQEVIHNKNRNNMGEVLINKVCSDELFENIQVAEEVEWEVGSLRAKIGDAVLRMATIRQLPIIPRAWQIEMAAGMLEKQDGVCITKTGDGKTFCFLAAALYNPSLIFIVVSPLISLMQDQVRNK